MQVIKSSVSNTARHFCWLVDFSVDMHRTAVCRSPFAIGRTSITPWAYQQNGWQDLQSLSAWTQTVMTNLSLLWIWHA